MAIKTPPGPALGPQIVGRAVNDLMPERAAAASVAGGGAPQATQPLPRYIVKLDDLTDVNFLAKAEQIGWRYLIVGAGPAAVADVKQVQSRKHRRSNNAIRSAPPPARKLTSVRSFSFTMYRGSGWVACGAPPPATDAAAARSGIRSLTARPIAVRRWSRRCLDRHILPAQLASAPPRPIIRSWRVGSRRSRTGNRKWLFSSCHRTTCRRDEISVFLLDRAVLWIADIHIRAAVPLR